MKYVNKKTGAVINVNSELSGGDWEAVTEPPEEKIKDSEQKNKGSAAKKAVSKTSAQKAVKNNG